MIRIRSRTNNCLLIFKLLFSITLLSQNETNSIEYPKDSGIFNSIGREKINDQDLLTNFSGNFDLNAFRALIVLGQTLNGNDFSDLEYNFDSTDEGQIINRFVKQFFKAKKWDRIKSDKKDDSTVFIEFHPNNSIKFFFLGNVIIGKWELIQKNELIRIDILRGAFFNDPEKIKGSLYIEKINQDRFICYLGPNKEKESFTFYMTFFLLKKDDTTKIDYGKLIFEDHGFLVDDELFYIPIEGEKLIELFGNYTRKKDNFIFWDMLGIYCEIEQNGLREDLMKKLVFNFRRNTLQETIDVYNGTFILDNYEVNQNTNYEFFMKKGFKSINDEKSILEITNNNFVEFVTRAYLNNDMLLERLEFIRTGK